MKRSFASLIVFSGSLALWQLQPALAAETDGRLEALSAQVGELKAGQDDIKEQLKVITDWLAGAPPSVPAPSKQAASPGDADTEALRKELEAMKKIVAGYKEREEKARLARLPVRDSDFTLQVGDADPSEGSAEAPVVLVEFTDYQCPFCGRHKKETMPELLKNYVETGKMRYVLRDFPLGNHKYAPKAHEAAHCAGEQGKYWEMSEQLFANQRALMPEKLPEYAQAAGVTDMAAFQNCLDSGKYAETAQRSLDEGVKAGVSGTPSFLLGVMEPDGKTFKARKFIRGAQKYSVFDDAIKEVMSAGEG